MKKYFISDEQERILISGGTIKLPMTGILPSIWKPIFLQSNTQQYMAYIDKITSEEDVSNIFVYLS